MQQRSLIAVFGATVFIFLFIYFSQSIAAFFAGPFFEAPTPKPPVLGRVITSSSHIFIRRKEATGFVRAADQTSLHHGDTIKAEKGGDAILAFSAGDQVRIFENSLFRLELFRAEKGQKYPLLLTVLQGTPNVLQKSTQKHGSENTLYISKDNQWLGANADAAAKPRLVTPSADVNTVLRPTNVHSLATQPPTILSNDKIKEALLDKSAAGLTGVREGLSTSYIESVIESKAEVLRRCQLNSLRDDGDTVGSLLLTMTIAPSGKVKSIHVAQRQLDNDLLINCTLSALKRLQFSKFTGDPVTLAYPIEFR